MKVEDSYIKLINKLKKYGKNNMIEIDDNMKKMLNYLVDNNCDDYTSLIANRIVSQYEETKDDITFGVVVENADIYYLTYILIFEKDKTYSNVLLRKFDKDKIMKAKSYFMELKDMIINNDLNKLSHLIIDKL